MRHKKYENLIVLWMYDEISSAEKANLESHLSSCVKCKEFRDSVVKILSRRKPTESLFLDTHLAEARSELHSALLNDVSVVTPKRRIVSPAVGWMPRAVPVYAMAAVVMFAVGVLSTYLYMNRNGGSSQNGATVLSELTSQNRNDVAIDEVRFLSTDQKTGEVKFTFNLIKRYEMTGSLDDRNVQKVLTYALANSDNPGVRLKTIGMLDASASGKPDKEIENALLKAVKTDDNVGVRREALLSLEKFPFNSEIKGALLFVLQNDRNPGMRVAAINFLSAEEFGVGSTSQNAKNIDPKMLDILKEKSKSDENRYVRLKAADMLKEFREL